ncbi:MAG: imidazole glycerol phosphate synthase subunit HisH, partial [Alphaproteobacteria bacterium]|nr:imidazole glycerol phosphate synthase subunit HisH [Alphaproteobacteria bacterium]
MQTIAVIDYGSGNLRSVERALLEAAARANRRREVRVTADVEFVSRADRIVLPGQGAFADCMAG